MPKPAKISAPKLLDSSLGPKLPIMERILEHQTSELVIAFCGPIGSGVSTIVSKFDTRFKRSHYKTKVIKASDIIKKHSIMQMPDHEDEYERINYMQTKGDTLRQRFGNEIIAQYVAVQITYDRKAEEKKSDDVMAVKKRKHVTLIDSLKHPDEVQLLQSIYGEMFYLVAVLCPEEIRKQRMQHNKEIKPDKVQLLIERDKSEKEKFGQQLIKTIKHADFFLSNMLDNISSLDKTIERFTDLILSRKYHTPTIHEYGMFIAQASALRSGCLSRQVGASILDNQGNIISTGRNDVPRGGGGLYTCEDGDNDNRCMNRYNMKCKSVMEKESIYKDIKKLSPRSLEKEKIKRQLLTKYTMK